MMSRGPEDNNAGNEVETHIASLTEMAVLLIAEQ